MESIYYVLCWHCHRRCKHCYEDRFHPYVRDELESVVSEAERNAPRIVANLPATMQYRDRKSPVVGEPTEFELKTGRIIISGGDVLTDPVRERVLYPTLEAIRDKYRDKGGVKVIVQTTGDLLTPKIVRELLDRDVWSISAAGMDDYHVGMQDNGKKLLADKLVAMFEAAGMIGMAEHEARRQTGKDSPPVYSMFGATDEAWIGKLWPRGRAWENGLSKATMADNFCSAWSGGLGFLEAGYEGSEVSIDPSGDVYPCCIKTAEPLGNLTEEPLLAILDSLAGDPAIEAINAGKPERMGLTHGWSVEDFIGASVVSTPQGEPYANLCIGCDTFHREVLGDILRSRRQQRVAGRMGIIASTTVTA
ncbi:radical SAM/SPASM domain-containing protein [Pseudohongiella sp.]|uniref:4Fe4S-binding SPASM domain-containing protein n=1 Tax=marine sediment metagenome TaxID=412755 RepID=A0A0F9VGZ0_9ZZZZ|nr:radical SAM/SPASM domain-containing protein [Pseudohongiella sp.]HDZ08924.1 radical SAM/SPASM domain-containing protein [Pseudohongiella sp.]HEA63998.1 radical SAM/SPASM domain-containing protein [Pseudohongiella sp.]